MRDGRDGGKSTQIGAGITRYAYRVPFLNFATNRHRQNGLVPHSANGVRGKGHEPWTIPANRFVQKYPAQTAKSVQMSAHSMPLPYFNFTSTLSKDAPIPVKTLSQHGIPLLLG
jgi:hypothetical protein